MPRVSKAAVPALPAAAARLGFHEPITLDHHQMIQIGLDGFPKAGKTHFTLEMAQHLNKRTAFVNINKGLGGVIEKFNGSKLMVVDLDYPEDNDQGGAMRTMKQYQEIWDWAMGDQVPIVVDKFNEVWGIAQIAAFGNKQPIALAYRPLNDGMKYMLDKMAGNKVHVVLIHDVADEYKGDVRTGEFVRQGFKHTEGKVEINAQLSLPHKSKTPTLTILNNRWDINLNGKELTGTEASFMGLGRLFFGKDWDPNA